jgi:hypothetical protein
MRTAPDSMDVAVRYAIRLGLQLIELLSSVFSSWLLVLLTVFGCLGPCHSVWDWPFGSNYGFGSVTRPKYFVGWLLVHFSGGNMFVWFI